eukprot:6207153-Pleurochrysis_carterae.AAC.1
MRMSAPGKGKQQKARLSTSIGLSAQLSVFTLQWEPIDIPDSMQYTLGASVLPEQSCWYTPACTHYSLSGSRQAV